MQSDEKITQKDSRLTNAKLTCGANAIIDLNALTVRTSQQFYLSKKFKKLALNLANEIANLEPKATSNLKAV